MAEAYLRRLGVVVLCDENCRSALERHAEQHDWKDATRKKHLQNMHAKMCIGSDKLDWWNDLLDVLGYEEQTSITKAREVFRGIFINIYDVESGKYHKQHASLKKLREYSIANDLIYPKKQAKAKGLQVFLKTF